MSTTQVTPHKPAGKPIAPKTDQQKKILSLQELKAKGKASDAQIAELKTLVIAERKAVLVKLATRRVNKLIDQLRQIGNLAAYKPSEAQTKAVFVKIKEAVDASYTKWAGNKAVENEFELPIE